MGTFHRWGKISCAERAEIDKGCCQRLTVGQSATGLDLSAGTQLGADDGPKLLPQNR